MLGFSHLAKSILTQRRTFLGFCPTTPSIRKGCPHLSLIFPRQADALGRVTIPVDVRRALGIVDGTPLELLVDGDAIVLRVWRPKCVFCQRATERQWRAKYVCDACLGRLAEKLVWAR